MGGWKDVMMNANNIEQQVRQVQEVLEGYREAHSAAQISVKAQNAVSIRIRIIDPDFHGMDRVDREPEVWKVLESLPEEVFTNITMLLLLAPEEAKTSWANMEFESPIPSSL